MPFHVGWKYSSYFLVAIHQARPNGLNLMTNSIVLTTPFTSNNQQLDLCKQVLNQKDNIGKQSLHDILDLLPLQNVVNLYQTSLLMSKGTAQTPKDAYERLVDAKMAVYWRDYHAIPQGITPDLFLGWANGSSVSPPKQLEHLLEKRGNLYFLRDPNFEAFLKQFYNPITNKLEKLPNFIR